MVTDNPGLEIMIPGQYHLSLAQFQLKLAGEAFRYHLILAQMVSRYQARGVYDSWPLKVTSLWMGDLETDFMENILNEVDFPQINVLFAPHHGRKSGKIPTEWLEEMDPDIIIMGEAPSANLDYAGYDGYNKITQNSAGDIVFDCSEGKIDIYVSSSTYSVDFLKDNKESNKYDCHYLGTLDV